MDDDTGYAYRKESNLPSREMDTILKIIVFIYKYYGKLVGSVPGSSLEIEKSVFMLLVILYPKRLGTRELENIFFKSSSPVDSRFKLENLSAEHQEIAKRKKKIIDFLKEQYLTAGT